MAVVDRGGFAQAARYLHRSQSAVSYAVARLQDSLDVPLLVIEGRRAVLTPNGETLLRRARTLVDGLNAVEALAASLKQGWEPELKLVVDAAYPRERLLKIVAELQVACPSTQIQLSDAILSGAEDAIVNDIADVVVSNRVPPGYLGEPLIDIEFVAVAAPQHPLCEIDHPLVAEDLIHHVQAVVRDSGSNDRRNDGWLGAERRCTVSSMESSLAIVVAGLAFAWLPEPLVADTLQRGVLQRLNLVTGGSRMVKLHLVLVHPHIAGPAAFAALESFRRHAATIGGVRSIPD
jgi:DNA-binding transcriptional LysR family regulator